MSSLNEAIRKVTKSIGLFKFNEAINIAYDFFWHKFCDWYLEIAKHDISDKNTQEVLLCVLKKSLLLLHPFMPFITDEISGKLPGNKVETIAVSAWPMEEKLFEDKASVRAMELVFGSVMALRNMRAELDLQSQEKLNCMITVPAGKRPALEKASGLIQGLAGAGKLTIADEKKVPKNCLSALVSADVRVYLILEGLVDVESEIERLDKQAADLLRQLKQKEKMLKNKEFLKKAPSEVVEREKHKMAEMKESLKRMKEVRGAFK